MAKQKSTLDKISDIFDKAAKLLKGPHKVASGAVIAAALGALLKLSEITKTFPPPSDMLGNLVIFVAVLLFIVDIAKGGLYD
jgi:hypothetical protein